ncbi:hypothetical protein [Corynebacterium lowii]|nr:hypothetical protein [Corynebacterium lowii]MDP9852045.1 hypothetical protein [Corynebacterium lowii]
MIAPPSAPTALLAQQRGASWARGGRARGRFSCLLIDAAARTA